MSGKVHHRLKITSTYKTLEGNEDEHTDTYDFLALSPGTADIELAKKTLIGRGIPVAHRGVVNTEFEFVDVPEDE